MNVFDQAADVIGSYKGYDGLGNEFVEDEPERIAVSLEDAGLLRSDEPSDEVMAFRTTGNNSHLIEDLFTLGYLTDEMMILDATYGRGVFWKRHHPPNLWTNDLDATTDADLNYDFTAFPEDMAARFDAVVFDPDYKLQGTSSNAGPASSNDRYGMDREYRAVADQLDIIARGLIECVRVTKPKGTVVVKAMDQVVSGSVVWQTIGVTQVMERLGCKLIDMLHLEGHRRQPTHDKCRVCGGDGDDGSMWCRACEGTGKVPRRQVHARRNYSTMMVFQRGK